MEKPLLFNRFDLLLREPYVVLPLGSGWISPQYSKPHGPIQQVLAMFLGFCVATDAVLQLGLDHGERAILALVD